MTHEIAVADDRGRVVEGEVLPPADTVTYEQVRNAVDDQARRGGREKLRELWERAAEGLREADHSRDAKLAAIHRDVRLIGDMVMDFSGRLEAMEKARNSDFNRVRQAWGNDPGDETTT